MITKLTEVMKGSHVVLHGAEQRVISGSWNGQRPRKDGTVRLVTVHRNGGPMAVTILPKDYWVVRP